MVEVMTGFGITLDRVCLVLGLDHKTVQKNYRAELERGRATVEAKLAGNLLKIASGSDNAALKATVFALQARFGWRIPIDPSTLESLEIGKKEAAQRAARTAGDATDWGDDLRTPRPRPN